MFLLNDYIKDINKALKEKNDLKYYNYLNNLIEIYNLYHEIIEKILSKSHSVIPNSKKNIISILFLSSIEYFNEAKNSIIISNYIATNCVLRIIIENYIILYFLYKNNEEFSKRYFDWVEVSKYKIIKTNKFIADNTEIEIKESIKSNYKEYEFKIKNDIKEFKRKFDGDKKDLNWCNSDNLIFRNNYGWISTKLNKNPNLKIIAANVSLNSEYESFEQLSSKVHSNEIFEKFLNNKKDIGMEIKTVAIFMEYMEKFLNLYFDVYNTDYKKIEFEKSIKKMDKDIESCIEIINYTQS